MTEAGAGALSGRVALVVGGASGIGRPIADAFVEQGGSVVVADLNGDRADAAAREIGARRGYAPDVRNAASVERVVGSSLAEVGPVDVLASAAGILTEPPVVEMSGKQWQEAIDVNLTGVFTCCRAVVPGLVERR